MDLELDAAGTGRVVFPNADLEVGGDIVVNGSAQYANLSASGTITADTVTVNTATINGQLNLEDIEINDNYITTTLSDSDLELRAYPGRSVNIPTNINIDNIFAPITDISVLNKYLTVSWPEQQQLKKQRNTIPILFLYLLQYD